MVVWNWFWGGGGGYGSAPSRGRLRRQNAVGFQFNAVFFWRTKQAIKKNGVNILSIWPIGPMPLFSFLALLTVQLTCTQLIIAYEYSLNNNVQELLQRLYRSWHLVSGQHGSVIKINFHTYSAFSESTQSSSVALNKLVFFSCFSRVFLV